MKITTFKVEGMHCEGCALIIQSFLERTSGVIKADVSFPGGEARILHDANVVGEGQLVEIIKKAGYRISTQKSS